MPINSQLITVANTAARVGRTPQTVRNWIRRYDLAYRVGDRWVIPAGVVRALERGVAPSQAGRYV